MSPRSLDNRAPEFPTGLQWFNTDHPLTLAQLRGKIVVLDFWTYCCINCMHIIPDLKRLEKKYPDELVVIGVHSGKFEEEKLSANIREAILRYGVEHPVVNDADMRIWNEYTVQGWPTVAVIDPLGRVVGSRSGEGVFEPVDAIVSRLIADYGPKGLLNRTPLHFALERDRQPETLLSFPGKVLADESSGRLFISDSGHNRIIVASPKDNSIERIIGSGAAGLKDGSFAEAEFRHPQGLALDGNTLYIADTENHAIRAADLKAESVATIAGTGKQAVYSAPGGRAKTAALSSPWDLVLIGRKLYIAMAGTHQLWVLDLDAGRVEPYAGTGQEGRIDGTLDNCALAQPSGITTDGRRLYFADSEDSSIRWADLPPDNRVGTIVGQDLFVFGDRDGVGDEVRLQHPLGVVWHDGQLYVADTYNSRIKRINPATRRATRLFGTGHAGYRDGMGLSAEFNEPGGLSFALGKLYIADTNNHAIRLADLATSDVTTLMFRNMDMLRKQMPEEAAPTAPPEALPEQAAAPGTNTLVLSVKFPERFHLNGEAPSRVVLRSVPPGRSVFADGKSELKIVSPRFPLRIPVAIRDGVTGIDADLVLYYCESGKDALCYFKEAHLVAPVKVNPSAAPGSIAIKYSVR